MNELKEQLKTIRNFTDIALLLISGDKASLLPTVLEALFEQAQAILDEHCIIGIKEE